MEKYTILLLLKATPKWLCKTREERTDFFNKIILPLFDKFKTTQLVKFFDSEYYNAKVSDFLIIETTDLNNYQYFIELLRDTEIYSVPLFEVVDIIPGSENAHKEFDEKIKNEPQ
jgi:hypothetical protein